MRGVRDVCCGCPPHLDRQSTGVHLGPLATMLQAAYGTRHCRESGLISDIGRLGAATGCAAAHFWHTPPLKTRIRSQPLKNGASRPIASININCAPQFAQLRLTMGTARSMYARSGFQAQMECAGTQISPQPGVSKGPACAPPGRRRSVDLVVLVVGSSAPRESRLHGSAVRTYV